MIAAHSGVKLGNHAPVFSVVMPYWKRPEALSYALFRMAQTYPTINMEIIIVDDGSGDLRLDEYPWEVRVLTLPEKSAALNPCVPFNAGVAAARSDVIVLTNPEIIHDVPVFEKMLGELGELGRDGYVMAATWCQDEGKWHCHSSMPRLNVLGVEHPEGSGLHFCAMLHKSLYEKAGGFDEEYRDGAGYEDNDFVMRLGKIGAVFKICDDLQVLHPKNGARTSWPEGAFERNAELFLTKWRHHNTLAVTFVCVQVGNYDGEGARYVNNLHDMVKRNLYAGFPGRFVCVTDDDAGLHEDIEVIPAPEGIEGWWVKLWLFKRGLFKDGERVIFFDLDTCIVGGLDEIANYRGQFATLRDFYYPQQVGPAVMLWEAGAYAATIWEEWDACGRPTTGHGDLWWITQLDQGRFARRADKLQDLFPGAFVSYKADCLAPNGDPLNRPPKGARVVCFHGQPRPTTCGADWVKSVWKIGGASLADLETVPNTNIVVVKRNVEHACGLDLPWLDMREAHHKAVLIVGGGPSVLNDLEEIRIRAAAGQTVCAVNGAAHFLHENGIRVDHHVMLDARKGNLRFVTPPVALHHYVASQCDPTIYEALIGQQVTIFHANTEGVQDFIPDTGKPVHLLGGGSTVGLMAMSLEYAQGYRDMHIYGFDSSFDAKHHAYPQAYNDRDAVVDAVVNGVKFKTTTWMVAQAQQFQELAQALANADCLITVHGEGLLPYMARLMSEPTKEAA